ncbi:MAG: hypothetical protein RL711_1349 [Bacteroidota bacterium]
MEQIMWINADDASLYLLFIQIKPPFKCFYFDKLNASKGQQNKTRHARQRQGIEIETRKTITQVYDQMNGNHHPSGQYINPLFKQYA